MIDDIYNKRILEFAGNMERIGQLAEPDALPRCIQNYAAPRLPFI